MTFEVLRENADYEISTEYPNVIRKRANGRIVSEFIENTGYVRLNLSERINGICTTQSFRKDKRKNCSA